MSSHTPHGSFDCLHLLQNYLCGCFLVFEGKVWFGAQFIYKNLRLALFADNKNNCLQEVLTVALCVLQTIAKGIDCCFMHCCRQWQDSDLPAGQSAKGQHI